MEIKIDTNSLERSELGTITGVIFVETKNGHKFPGDGWYDFPVVIVGWWLDEITKLLDKNPTTAKLLFMDGSEFILVSVNKSAGLFEVKFVEPISNEENIVGAHLVDVQVFASSLVTAANKILQVCINKNWKSKDVTFLQVKVRELVKFMENGSLSGS